MNLSAPNSYLPKCKVVSVIFTFCAFIALQVASTVFIYSQQPDAGATPTELSNEAPAIHPSRSNTAQDSLYRIGPGDLIEISILNRPTLSNDAIRVDGSGMIQMPLIDGDIKAACRTESELAKEIVARYVEYLKNPTVRVFVKEYQSRPVAVIGAVNTPGRFQLQRPVRLLELLTFAGGPAERAGSSVQIIHSSSVSCDEPDEKSSITDSRELDLYNLSDLLRGDNDSNPFLRSGDIVSILAADQAFVVGNVFRPSAILLKEPITVSRALAMAGGTLPSTKHDQIRIIRQVAKTNTKESIPVDLKAINQRQAEDIVLQPNDVVEVPTSGTKVFLKSLVGAVGPALSRLPLYVVP
jgi:polysaccharide biosynthesis/export protein